MIVPRPRGVARLRIGEIQKGSSLGKGEESGQSLLDSIKGQLTSADRVVWIEVAKIAGDIAHIDALVCVGDPGPNFIQTVEKKRSLMGLPNQWPLLATHAVPSKGQVTGFGGIQLGRLANAEGLLQKATAYRTMRRAQSASALRSFILAMGAFGLILAGILWFGFGKRDRFNEVLFELAQTDYARLERRLEVSPQRLKYQADLLKEVSEHPRWVELGARVKEKLIVRKQELEKYLLWMVEAQKIPPPEDLFLLTDLREANQRVGRLVENADPTWSALGLVKQANASQEHFSKLLVLARDRLEVLRGAIRNGVDLASWQPPAPKNIDSWQIEARKLLSANHPRATDNVEKLLEVAEAKVALERVLEQIRAQRGWLGWLSLEKAPLVPSFSTSILRGGISAESRSWRDSVSQFPGAFRDRMVLNARKVESDLLSDLILELETIWPGRNPTKPIPINVSLQLATQESHKELRKWIIALRLLQIPSDRSLPDPDSLDPWFEVERFVSFLPREYQPTRVEVEGPLDAAIHLGEKQTLRLASGPVDWVLDRSVRDNYPGKGTFTLTFEIQEKKTASLNDKWTARWEGEKLQVLWNDSPLVPWGTWTTLQHPGTVEPPDFGKTGQWRLRLVPGLPIIPALLRPKP